MRVLVTGGHGFIGSFLVEKLLKEGCSVRCLVRKTSDLKWVKDLPIEFVYGDITQPATLPPAVKDVETIYHVAGALKGSSRKKYYSVNSDGTLYLAKAALKNAPNLKRFVFVSSVTATGPVQGTRKPEEDEACHPVSDYGKSKLEAEQRLKKECPQLPVTIIRPPIVYGPRDTNFLQFFKFAKRGFFPLPAPYQRYYSIVYVSDLVNGIYVASQRPEAIGKTYFIADTKYYSFEEMAEKLSRPFLKKPRFIKIPRFVVRCIALLGDCYELLTKKDVMITTKKFPEIEAASWLCSTDRAARELDFKTAVSLSEGAQETVDWLRSHRYL